MKLHNIVEKYIGIITFAGVTAGLGILGDSCSSMVYQPKTPQESNALYLMIKESRNNSINDAFDSYRRIRR